MSNRKRRIEREKNGIEANESWCRRYWNVSSKHRDTPGDTKTEVFCVAFIYNPYHPYTESHKASSQESICAGLLHTLAPGIGSMDSFYNGCQKRPTGSKSHRNAPVTPDTRGSQIRLADWNEMLVALINRFGWWLRYSVTYAWVDRITNYDTD